MDAEALYLDVDGRDLRAVPDELRGMARLRHLDLRDNGLTAPRLLRAARGAGLRRARVAWAP